MLTRMALIGFGEVGSTFARAAGWAQSAAVWDINPARKDAMVACGVRPAVDAAEALADVPLVLSFVTADEAEQAARAYAPLLSPGALWCDMNSVAPQTKRAACEAIETAGGRYVDVAVLAPVQPAGLGVPLLLAGTAADEAEALLRTAGFTNARITGTQVGQASAIKMIRSVMVKGIEALTAEMILAAEAADVVDEVLASLDASEKRICWTERTDYNLERMAMHGARRAAEMEEAAKTLAALGVEPVMTSGTIRRQREMAGSQLRRKDCL